MSKGVTGPAAESGEEKVGRHPVVRVTSESRGTNWDLVLAVGMLQEPPSPPLCLPASQTTWIFHGMHAYV